MFGLPIGRLVIASVIAGVIGIGGALVIPKNTAEVSNIYISAPTGPIQVGQKSTVGIIVQATEPVNVFKGLLVFDSERLQIDSIDYNTSVADLWAEEPWYSNGDGTLSFIGGTTRQGGFTGNALLITVSFRALQAGEAAIRMEDVQILRHDGLGSEAAVGNPIDTIFTIQDPLPKILATGSSSQSKLLITKEKKSTDLNNDGKQSIADISIFMSDLAKQNMRSDFNEDGSVNLQDLSILTKQ